MQEKADVETIAADALERLIKDLNVNHAQTKGQMEKKIKKMQQDYNVKMDQHEIIIKSKD